MGWFPRLTPVRLSPQVPDLMTVSEWDSRGIQVRGQGTEEVLAGVDVGAQGGTAGLC